jgi:hypothetical protein
VVYTLESTWGSMTSPKRPPPAEDDFIPNGVCPDSARLPNMFSVGFPESAPAAPKFEAAWLDGLEPNGVDPENGVDDGCGAPNTDVACCCCCWLPNIPDGCCCCCCCWLPNIPDGCCCCVADPKRPVEGCWDVWLPKFPAEADACFQLKHSCTHYRRSGEISWEVWPRQVFFSGKSKSRISK